MNLDSIIGWLPPYTEEWATAYLQVLFEGFVFAVGVPTTIYSLALDNDVKRVALTRLKASRYFIATALLYLASFILIWSLPPDTAGLAPGAGSATPPPAHASEGAAPGAPAPQADAPRAASRAAIAKSVVAAASVTLIPFLVLIAGLWLNSRLRRERVVERLANELFRRLGARRSIDTVALKDLSYLGENGNAGGEKGMVLDAVELIVRRVQARVAAGEMEYRGYELESLIRRVPVMLDNAVQPGSSDNYRRAADVLAGIWRWLVARGVNDDALSTREALRSLAVRSVEVSDEDTSLAYLDVAADCDSHMVFDIGLSALANKKYRLAAAALTKLEAMAWAPLGDGLGRETGREVRANLLGMAACLASDGPSGLLRAEEGLFQSLRLFTPTLRRALADAFDYHYRAGRIDISDAIQRLVASAGGMKRVDLDGPASIAAPERAG